MEEGSFRGRAVEDIGEEGVEYAPSEDGDISQQLGEKVRSQAQRLAALEQYRLLCENRILELAPSHPLPVLPDHLGLKLSDSNRTELHQAYQKIARLEQELAHSHSSLPLSDFHSFPPPTAPLTFPQLQDLYSALYHKAQSLMGEKLELEEGLRAEVLRTEEQRAYIEALKQALETKMEEFGFRSGSVDAFTDLTHVQAKLTQLQREHSRCSLSLSDQSSAARSLQEQLALKAKEAADAQSHSGALSKELDEVTVALQQSVEELSRLEEEKSALLDYVQERAEADKALADSKAQLEEELASEKDAHQRCRSQLELLEKRVRGLQSSHSEALSHRDQLSELQSTLGLQLEATTAKLASAESRVKTLEAQLGGVGEQAKQHAVKSEKLQMNNSTLASTLKETQAELDQVRASNVSYLEELKSDKESLLAAKTRVRELQEQNRSLSTELRLCEERLSGFDSLVEKIAKENQDRLHQSLEKQDSAVRENLTLKQRIREVEAEIAAQREEWMMQTTTFEGETKGMKSTLEALQSQLGSVNKEKEVLERKVLEYREKVEESSYKSLQTEVKRLGQTASSAQRRVEMLTEENTLLRTQIAQAESEGRSLAAQLHDREKKLAETLAANEALRANLESLQADLDKISSDTQAMAEEALRARQQERFASQTLTQHSDELTLMRKVLTQSAGAISQFASNFGTVAAATAAYTAVISTAFRDLIVKWSDWAEGDFARTAEALLEWVITSTDESEALIRRLVELKAEVASSAQRQSQLESRTRDFDRSEGDQRARTASLERELDSLADVNAAMKRENEGLYFRVESLTTDNVQSRREVQALSDELRKAKAEMEVYMPETIKWKAPVAAAEDMFSQKGLEEKVALLVKEKKDLEALISRLTNAVQSPALQRLFLDMMKTRNEIEISERDRLRIEGVLMVRESEMRLQTRSGDHPSASDIRKEVDTLRLQLSDTETALAVSKRKMYQLEVDLQDIEKAERRRTMLEENERKQRDDPKPPVSARSLRNPSPEASKDDSFQSSQSIESRLTRLSARENRPRLTIQDKLSQAKAELSQLRKKPLA